MSEDAPPLRFRDAEMFPSASPGRTAQPEIASGLVAQEDPGVLCGVYESLVRHAWRLLVPQHRQARPDSVMPDAELGFGQVFRRTSAASSTVTTTR